LGNSIPELRTGTPHGYIASAADAREWNSRAEVLKSRLEARLEADSAKRSLTDRPPQISQATAARARPTSSPARSRCAGGTHTRSAGRLLALCPAGGRAEAPCSPDR